MIETLAFTDDLRPWAVIATLLLATLSAGLLLWEVVRQRRARGVVFLTGLAATLALLCAVLRPVSVSARVAEMGPRIVVLVDQSRRMLLPAGKEKRSAVAERAVEELKKHFRGARLSVFGFAEGALRAYDGKAPLSATESNFVNAAQELANLPGERPSAVVLVSDGRLTRPIDVGGFTGDALLNAGAPMTLHTVAVADVAPKDASIRSVRAAGAAVAHQSLAVSVEVGCAGGLACQDVPVRIRELLRGEKPIELARGTVTINDGVGRVELSVTLDRSGSRVLEVGIESPEGDTIPENNTRYLTFSVSKERIRLLHLAGRPTFDVRALRNWVKSDEAVDVVAFFILRGDTDDPGAGENDLALIRFPVDELFTEHLQSFDAVILQDIDAVRYKLSRYLVRLERYVKNGGGLIMVGGPASFAGGNYAGTPLDSVLPVEQPKREREFDSAEFVPQLTESGQVAPITRNLRNLLDNRLPAFAGANLLGPARPSAIVLMQHPTLRAGLNGNSGPQMPVLALGEAGDGRAIALAVDSTYRLAYSELAATVGGRAYGALWDGLLGWLMHDPRYEAARVDLLGECIAGQATTFRIARLPGMNGDIRLALDPLDPSSGNKPIERVVPDNHAASTEVVVEGLRAGGYTARVNVGAAPATRQDFGCEAGGEAFADSRPDPERLSALARLAGGQAVTANNVSALPSAKSTQVTSERRVKPLLPPWAWTAFSAMLLGAHWLIRRRAGLL